MDALLLNLQMLLLSVWGITIALLGMIVPWTPLIAWIAYWLLAANWTKLRVVLFDQGGILGVFLIAVMGILIWGLVAPPGDGFHYLFGLKVANFVGKTVYVTAMVVIMFLCGTVQLSGACDPWIDFSEPEPAADSHGHDSHGHDSHGHDSHGHDAHGHGGH